MIFRDHVIVFQQPGAPPKGAVEDVLRQVRALDMTEVQRGVQPHEPGEPAGDA
jgi:thioredoxin 1